MKQETKPETKQATKQETRVIMSEVLAALSYALDLTDGQSAGHTIRSCLIGMRIGEALGLDSESRAELYYALLLKDAGCSSNAARMCQLFGTDDRVVKPTMKFVDWHDRLSLAVHTAALSGKGRSLAERIRCFVAIASEKRVTSDIITVRCERGAEIARRLGFPESTARAIRHLDEHWNGRGHPEGRRGRDIPLGARIASLAQTFEVFHRRDGVKAAMRMARARSGRWFDPELVKLLHDTLYDQAWWQRLGDDQGLEAAVVAQEPASRVRWVRAAELDEIARAFSDIIDAKSPYTFQHSRNVAAHALAIAQRMGLNAAEQRTIYRGGLLHDIGKLGVSNCILDKAGSLTASERSDIEQHPVFTWKILARVRAFGDFAWTASLHHEKLDGSGYPWKLTGDALDLPSRILCVADIYEALTADRPYRSGLAWEQSSRILRNDCGSKLDPDVFGVLEECVRTNTQIATPDSLAA